MAVSPLAPPISLKLMGSGADPSRIAGYFALLTILSVILVPPILAISSVVLGTKLQVSVAAIAQTSLMLLIVPVALGVTINTLRPHLAQRAAKPIALAAYAVLGVATLILLASKGPAMASLAGDGSIAAMIMISLAAIAAGHLLGGPDFLTRQLFATAAGVRHPGLSLLIVGANSAGEQAVTAVLLFLLINLVISAIYQRWATAKASRDPAAAQS
jgi:BASS family bile acid:Na+ symporter